MRRVAVRGTNRLCVNRQPSYFSSFLSLQSHSIGNVNNSCKCNRITCQCPNHHDCYPFTIHKYHISNETSNSSSQSSKNYSLFSSNHLRRWMSGQTNNNNNNNNRQTQTTTTTTATTNSKNVCDKI